MGAITGVKVGKHNLGTRASKCKVSVRVGKRKLGARSGRCKLRDILGPAYTNWGPWPRNTNLGPGPGARAGAGKYKDPKICLYEKKKQYQINLGKTCYMTKPFRHSKI